MDDNETRRILICTQRNAILSSLTTIWPGKIDGAALFRSMLDSYPNYCRTCFVKDLYYLEAKGYVERHHPHPQSRLSGPDVRVEWSEAKWRVTPAGNEVANAIIRDPALEV